MGPQEDYIETVFTCEGDINDPNLHSRLEDFQSRLRELLSTDKRKLILKKVEPWNSVRVTFNIPREAAWRLKQLAQQGNVTLRQLGVLAVQIEGDQLISLTIAGRNNERTQLIFRTADDTVDAPNLSLIDSGGSTNDFGSPGPTNVQSTRKNIAEYLRQGAGASIFDSIFPTQDSDIAQSVSSIASGRTPNLPLHNPNFHPERNISTASLHNVSHFSAKTPAGNAFHNFQADYEQNRTGLDKPPPPYPEGSAWFNNVAKGIRGLPPTTSPLLVNLLQTEPSLSAGMNNFINSKMLPPPPDSSPPLKKKRKPRKPKDKTGCEGEALIQSLPNPVLSTYSLPVTASFSNSLPSPMVTQALAANTQPLVTFSKSVPSPSEMLFVSSVGEEFHDKGKLTPSQSCKALSKVSKVTNEPFESTTEKIINPYTGLLEPMEHSDTIPSRNCIPFERLSPQGIGLKSSISEQTSISKEKLNHVFSHTKLQSNTVSSVPTLCTNSSVANVSLQQSASDTNTSQSVGSHNQGSDSLSVTMSVRNSGTASQNHISVQSSPVTSISKNSDMFDLSRKSYSQSQTGFNVNVSSSIEMYKNAVTNSLNKAVATVVSSGLQTNTADLTYSSYKQLSNKDHLKKFSSENLLNPLKNPAKVKGSCLERGSGVDSENSNHTGLVHDTHMQNDIGAASMGCTETNSKSYYNDSGVGSSSERSDDTPSEPGDSDFKAGNNHIDEFSKSVFHESLAHKQTSLNKPDPQIITVGYAMSNVQLQNEKHSNDVSNILAIDKALNYPTLKKQTSEISRLNNDIDHQVAMMHLLNKNRKRSPKHLVHEEALSSLTKEHLHLLQKVDSMQYLKDNFLTHGKQEKSNQLGVFNTRLAVPHRIENPHSPTNITPDMRTPSPRLLTNHDSKETRDMNLCNKVKHSVGNTPISEVETLQNDLASKFLEQHQNMSSFLTQKKHERKAKSPVSGMNLTVSAAMELISMENLISSSSANSTLCKHSDAAAAHGIMKNDILNNIKRPDNLNESDSVKVSKSGAYKRRSPAAAMLNPLPQQFYDPKKLTESVQKLVKPLISESSLPHSQRRSPGSVVSRACTSPLSHKSDGLKGSDSLDNTDNVIMQESDSVSNSDSSHSVASDIFLNSSSGLPKIELESRITNLNTSNFNHVLTEKMTKSNELQNSEKTSAKNSIVPGNHSLYSQENCHSSSSADKYSGLLEKNSSMSGDNSGIEENHKHILSENVKVPIEISVSESSFNASKSDASKVPTNIINPDAVNLESDKTSVKTSSKSSGKRVDNLCNTAGVEYSSLKVNCDSEKNSPRSSQKSPSLSPVKRGKGEETRPIKLHLSHGVITQPFSKEELATETNITVITRTDPRKLENSAGEPTVPPLVLKVSRKTTVVEPSPEPKQEESQSLTMSLRARKSSETTESVHNLRPPKPIRQKSVDQADVEQYKIIDDSSAKSLRQSRRRKTTVENEGLIDSEKKAHIENCVQDSDQKTVRTEEIQTESTENLTLFDTVKSGLRARAQNKPVSEEKIKVSPKEIKNSKIVEEDPSLRRNSQNKRNRQSPTLTADKQQTKEARDKSPGRAARTRSGQVSPSVDDDNSKRSTRSAKPRNQIVDAQNDATETLPPASKRRRTTSRDHR